jgi:hypothetical protein
MSSTLPIISIPYKEIRLNPTLTANTHSTDISKINTILELNINFSKKVEKIYTKINTLTDNIEICLLNQNLIIKDLNSLKEKLKEFE